MAAFTGDTGREVCGYRLGRTLGKGMSGKVKLGARLTDGYLVALKFIDKATLMPRQHEMLVREVTAMQRLAHPHILQLYQVEDNVPYPRKNPESKPAKCCVMLVLELSNGGELFDYLMHTGPFDEVLARTYFRQLLASLEVCHNKGVAHRDLKPENLLLDGTFNLKLADFGLASVSPAEHAAPLACATECGTRSYMSPEVMIKQPYDGTKADLWSAGVVLFIMLAGNPPFQVAGGTDWWYRACAANRHDRFWMAHLRTCPQFPPSCQDLLNSVFVVDPSKRANIADLWDHPWVQGPTLGGEHLQAAMAGRAAQANAAKEQELAAAQTAKAAAAGNTAGSTFDPYAASAAYRSVGSSSSSSSSSSSATKKATTTRKLAPPPPGLLTFHYIDAAAASLHAGGASCEDVIAGRVAEACEALGPKNPCTVVSGLSTPSPSPTQPLRIVKASFGSSLTTTSTKEEEEDTAVASAFDDAEEPPALPPSISGGGALAPPNQATATAGAGGAPAAGAPSVEVVASLWSASVEDTATATTATGAPPRVVVYRLDVERRSGDPLAFAALARAIENALAPLLKGQAVAVTAPGGEAEAEVEVAGALEKVKLADEAEAPVLPDTADEDVF